MLYMVISERISSSQDPLGSSYSAGTRLSGWGGERGRGGGGGEGGGMVRYQRQDRANAYLPFSILTLRNLSAPFSARGSTSFSSCEAVYKVYKVYKIMQMFGQVPDESCKQSRV